MSFDFLIAFRLIFSVMLMILISVTMLLPLLPAMSLYVTRRFYPERLISTAEYIQCGLYPFWMKQMIGVAPLPKREPISDDAKAFSGK